MPTTFERTTLNALPIRDRPLNAIPVGQAFPHPPEQHDHGLGVEHKPLDLMSECVERHLADDELQAPFSHDVVHLEMDAMLVGADFHVGHGVPHEVAKLGKLRDVTNRAFKFFSEGGDWPWQGGKAPNGLYASLDAPRKFRDDIAVAFEVRAPQRYVCQVELDLRIAGHNHAPHLVQGRGVFLHPLSRNKGWHWRDHSKRLGGRSHA